MPASIEKSLKLVVCLHSTAVSGKPGDIPKTKTIVAAEARAMRTKTQAQAKTRQKGAMALAEASAEKAWKLADKKKRTKADSDNELLLSYYLVVNLFNEPSTFVFKG